MRLGYACINNTLRDYNVFSSHSFTLATSEKESLEYIEKIVMKNVDDLFKIIIANEMMGIRFFRITSNLFPHIDNPKMKFSGYDTTFAKKKLQMIGKYAKANNHRLTMHPGQYVQLGSDKENVRTMSGIILSYHKLLLDYLGYGPEQGSVLILHGGGTFNDKPAAIKRFKETFNNLPKGIQDLIVLENDENQYNVTDILELCEDLNIPMCLDIFHNEVSKDPVDLNPELLTRIWATWKNRTPKIHISNQKPDSKRGAHSTSIDELPEWILNIPKDYKIDLDIMLEVKDKEQSVSRLHKKYFVPEIDSTGKLTWIFSRDTL